MKITVPHPVFAPSMINKSGEPGIAAGILLTDFEVPEYSNRDSELAYRCKFSQTILKIDGKLWQRSGIRFEDVERVGLLAETIDQYRDTSCIVDDYTHELHRIALSGDLPLYPKPSVLLTRSEGPNKELALHYLRKLGAFTKRAAKDADEEAIENWRNRMREFLSGFALVDGVPYERVHEPLLCVKGQTIIRRSASILERHANRTTRNHLGLIEGDDDHWHSDLHCFSFGDEEAAVALSDEVSATPGGGTAQWITMECLTTPTAPEVILEKEACRFSAIHLRNFEEVSDRWKARLGDLEHAQALSDADSPLGSYALAAREAQEAVAAHQFDEPDFERVRNALDALVTEARSTDQAFMCGWQQHEWEVLADNTDRHLARLDALPVALHVKPSWEAIKT